MTIRSFWHINCSHLYTGIQAVRVAAMNKVLHILKSEPDDTVIQVIEALAGDEGAMVVNLYDDQISGTTTNWARLVDDIFAHDQVICWW